MDTTQMTNKQSQRQLLIDTFLDRNSKINLSAIRTPEWVRQKHVLDSLEWAQEFSDLFVEWKTVIDIGTWWWFPLLPCAITHSQCTFVWLDARKKKMKAVQAIIDEIEIPNCSTIRSRAEDHKVRYDIVMSRAVAYADKLMQRSLPRMKKGWTLLWRKMYTIEEEAEIRELCHRFNCKIVRQHEYTLEWDDVRRVIYEMRKV